MKSLLLGCLAAGTALLAGCGGSDGRVATYPVSGTVTLSGSPVAGASVMFAGQEKQPIALGRTDSQGHFTLTTYDAGDGAVAGSYAVIITKNVSKGSGTNSSGNAPSGHSSPANYGGHSAQAMQAATSSAGGLIPSKYQSSETTPIKKEVKAGEENVFKIEL